MCHMEVHFRSHRVYVGRAGGGFEPDFSLVDECRAYCALSRVMGFRPLTWPWWTGDFPGGRRPCTNAALEHIWSADAEKTPEMQGKVVQFNAHFRRRCGLGFICHGVIPFLYLPSACFKRLLWEDALQGVLYQSGIGQEGGKENVDPVTTPKLVRIPRARKVSIDRRCPLSVTLQTVLASRVAQVRTHKFMESLPYVVGTLLMLCPRCYRNGWRMWRRMSMSSPARRFLQQLRREP